MDTGPKIAQVAALVGDPARANTLGALMDGRTLTASELAYVSGVAPQARMAILRNSATLDCSRRSCARSLSTEIPAAVMRLAKQHFGNCALTPMVGLD
jgi:hypothetical protein